MEKLIPLLPDTIKYRNTLSFDDEKMIETFLKNQDELEPEIQANLPNFTAVAHTKSLL